MLVPMHSTVFHPDHWPKAGAFPMVPFSNRLPTGELLLRDQALRLRCGPQGHPVHGFGHRRAWRLIARTVSSCSSQFTHDGQSEGWPWPFEAKQDVTLCESGIEVSLSITNGGQDPMPAGLGWHPYHPTTSFAPGAQLHAQATAVRNMDATGRVAASHPFDEHLDLNLARTVALERWAGTFNIPLRAQRSLQVATTGVHHLAVHRPQTGDYVCAEPITVLPGTLLGPENTSVLAAGSTQRISWRVWLSGGADA